MQAAPLPSVTVVIPALDAGALLGPLVAALRRQAPSPPRQIVVVDSGSTDGTQAAAASLGAEVIRLEAFSHGGARNAGAKAASGEIVVFLSQDALPESDSWLAELLAPFADPEVAAAYSRQVPRPGASPMERFFLLDRFPPGPEVRRLARPGEHLTLEGVFFSNVSSAVRREALLAHPFDETLIMSEDQQLSRDLIGAGMTVVYRPSSVVVHSHDYTLATAFRRYFDSVYSLRVVFPAHSLGTSSSMGARYVLKELAFVARGNPLWLPYYLAYTAVKTAATLAAHFADRLPRWLVRRMSLHRYHWER